MNTNSDRVVRSRPGGFFRRRRSLLIPLLCLCVVGCSDSGGGDSAADALGTLQLVSFYLPDGQDQLHEFHRFQYVIGVRPSAEIPARTAVTANIFLVDSRRTIDDQPAESDPQCHVGSTEIILGEPGETVVTSDRGMPLSGCASASGSSQRMSFAVHLEPNDRLLADETLDAANHYILTDAMKSRERNRGCSGADGQPGCVEQLSVYPSSGLDLEITGLTLESSIMLNYTRTENALHHDEVHTPNAAVTVEMWVDGVTPNQSDALPDDEAAEISFAIRPAAGGAWMPLTVMDPGSRTPFDHLPSFTVDTITSGGPNSFSHRLFLPQAVYVATGPGGAWEGQFQFELRACAHPSFDEADIPGRAEAENNCRVSPFFLTERLAYNPDVLAEPSTNVAPLRVSSHAYAPLSEVQSLEAVTEGGFKKPYGLAMGSGIPLLVSLSLENQAVYGVKGEYYESGGLGHLKPGTGVPFAAIRTGLNASQSGWLDVELLKIEFSHTITHRDPASGPDDFERKYRPGLQLRIFGARFVDIEGVIPLPDGATTIVDKSRLEALGGLFIKKPKEQGKEDDEISYAQQLCQKNGIEVQVVRITLNICVVGTVGLGYDISVVSLSPPFTGRFIDAKSVAGLDVSIGPFSKLTLIGAANVDVTVLQGQLAAEADLIKIRLLHQLPNGDYRDGAGFSLTTGALSESAILGSIGTQGVLEERMLDGRVRFVGRVVSGITFVGYFEPRVKWKKIDMNLWSWEGIVLDRQRLWETDSSDSVDAAVISMP